MEVALISGIDPNCIKNPGGTRAYVLNLINTLAKNGIKTTLIGISLCEKDLPQKSSYFTFIPIVNGSSISEIKFLFHLILKAKNIGLKKSSVIHAQRPDLLLPFILFYKKNLKICTLHGIGYNDIYVKKGRLLGGIYRSIESYALKRADRIIAVDETTGIFYRNLYPWLEDKIIVIPVGIDTELFKPMDKHEMREKYGFKENDKIILFVGRFERVKGLDLLLRSFKEAKKGIPDCKLILVGDGREKGNLENLAKYLGLSDIILMKTIGHEQIPEIMNCADVFALSSFREGMPTVVLESLACGVPVVSTDVGDVHLVVKDSETGYIVKTRSMEELKEKLINVLSSRDKFKENCIATAREYSREKIANKIIRVYDTVLRG